MLPLSRSRWLSATTRQLRLTSSRSGSIRSYSTSDPVPTSETAPQKQPQNVSATNATPTSSTGNSDKALQETPERSEKQRVMQAPDRQGVWSRSQNPRSEAMTGPRFEQTIMHYQPQPQAAIDLIHKQPVRWTSQRVVSCDGGGGPLGHPRIFINVDKPQVCWCTYCGLPFAHEHHRKHLESLPSTPYPLAPQGDAAEVSPSQRITDEALAQR